MNFYIKAICHSIIGIVILLLSSLIIIPSLLKLVVTKILYRLFTGHNMDCLTGIDAMCMYLGAKRNSISNKYYSHHYINLVIMVNGFIDIGKFVQRFQEKVIDAVEYPNGPKTFPRMTHLVVQKLNYFTWMPDNNFDVFNHFRINDVGYSDESSLMSVLANVFELPLPLERPPWEVVVIPKVVSPSPDDQLESCRRDNYVLVFKCHHCLVDGLAIYELAKCLVSEDTKWNSLPGELIKIVKNELLLPCCSIVFNIVKHLLDVIDQSDLCPLLVINWFSNRYFSIGRTIQPASQVIELPPSKPFYFVLGSPLSQTHSYPPV